MFLTLALNLYQTIAFLQKIYIMKKLFAGAALLGAFVLGTAQTITFDKTIIDYGTIKPGSDGQRYFTVTNTGDKPLNITNVKASCGCTTPVWPTEAIQPGKSAKIKVGYDTNIVDPNGFRKIIEVFSNDPQNGRATVYITGKIDPNAPEAATAAPTKAAETKADAKAVRTTTTTKVSRTRK